MPRTCKLRRWSIIAALALLGAIVCALGGQPASVAAAESPELVGFVRIELPITSETVTRIRHAVRRAIKRADGMKAHLTVLFEFVQPPEQAEAAKSSEFGAALTLAEFISSEDLQHVRTVAFVPEPEGQPPPSIQGHAVLAILACNDMILGPKVTLGPVSGPKDEPDPVRRTSYATIANRHKTMPTAIALWMLDPSQELYRVKTNVSEEYVLGADLPEFVKRHREAVPKKLFDPANLKESIGDIPGQISAQQAGSMRIIQNLYLVDPPDKARTRDKALEGLGLKDAPRVEDRDWRPMRIDLRGPIGPNSLSNLQPEVEREIQQRGMNFLCVWIESPGGSLEASVNIAQYLDKLARDNKVDTMAYVPTQARSDAALVAFACKYVYVHPNAVLGGPGAREFTREEVTRQVISITDENGPWRHRSMSLVAAVIDPQMTVFRYARPGQDGRQAAYYTNDEYTKLRLQAPGKAEGLKKGELVTTPGRQFEMVGSRAVELALADRAVDDFNELKADFGLEKDPTLVAPNWANQLVSFLASVRWILVCIGLIALYVELHTPGIGLGGFIATVCFVLFFWSAFLSNTADLLAVALFVAGIACLLVEFFFLPGFGVFGIGGGLLILVSLVLASQTFILPQNSYQFAELQKTLIAIALTGVGFSVAAYLLRNLLPRAPLLNQLFLESPDSVEAERIRQREALVDFSGLVGQTGTAATQLTPSGKARIGERLVDVITEGDFIERGASLSVVEVKGNRVVVKRAEG